MIALGHGTTGIDEPCAPSLSESLLGLSTPVAGFVLNGYAVALPDYQGLGSAGVHPYTDARTAGLNMIDSVRALRHTFKNVSNRWAAVGGSQGGGAAWAADEQASDLRAGTGHRRRGRVFACRRRRGDGRQGAGGHADLSIRGPRFKRSSSRWPGCTRISTGTTFAAAPPPSTGMCCRRAQGPRSTIAWPRSTRLQPGDLGPAHRGRCGPTARA